MQRTRHYTIVFLWLSLIVISHSQAKTTTYDLKLVLATANINVTAVNTHTDSILPLSRMHPASRVRLNTIGIETQHELNFALEKTQFFNKETQLTDNVLLFLNYANSFYYLNACATAQSNPNIRTNLADNPSPTTPRYRNNLDCDAWLYDLYRLDHTDTDQAPKPQQYSSQADLSKDQKKYVRKQRNLSLLNFVDPFLINVTEFTAQSPINGQPVNWNFTLRHHLTSFGYTLNANLFFKQKPSKVVVVVHNFFNKKNYFPGFDVKMSGYPFVYASSVFRLSTRLGLWLQPADQSFNTSVAKPGGFASVKLGYVYAKNIEPYIELEAKSTGWVAGNRYIESNYRIQTGISIDIDI